MRFIFTVGVDSILSESYLKYDCCFLHRRQMVENLKKMQELKAQIQAQMKLAETLKKLSENAGT